MGDGNTQLAMQFFDGFNNGNLTHALEIANEDMKFSLVGAPTMNKREYTALLTQLLDALEPGARLEVDQISSVGNFVLARGHGIMRVKDTGADYNNKYMWFAEIQDGKAISWEEYADTGLAERAFGRSLIQVFPILGDVLMRNS